MAPLGTPSPTPAPAAPTKPCPKCGHGCEALATECPRCQIVFDKLAQVEHRRRAAREEGAKLGRGPALERLALVDRLMIRQHIGRLEAFTGFEQANSYTVMDALGNALFQAVEESGALVRQILKSMRPFKLHVATPEGEPVLTLDRPFRFYFAELNVVDGTGRVLGSVKKRWSIVNRRYTLSDAGGGAEYEIFGPFFRPWTFRIRRNGEDVGVIRKKWSGALSEVFTDSDMFGIEFPRELDIRLKTVFLGAVFLIDFMHFEDNND